MLYAHFLFLINNKKILSYQMVKVKIKTNKKRVYEAAPTLSRHTVQMGAKVKSPEERRRELQGIWGRLMKQKDVDIRKLYGKTLENSGYHIPLAKMNVPIKVKVTDAITGNTHVEEIIPAEIAAFCDMAKTNAMSQQHLGTILQRFPKPVIWSFKVDTAASDGVRIAFNPIFAQQLIYQGKQQVKDALASGKRMSGDERTIRVARLFLFVLVHEAYHQIYRHREQAERKSETQGGSNHRLANIAMDAEINRDIEKQIPQWFAGATAESAGIFDTRFRMEPWQDIFDAYFYKKLEPPQQTNPNPINQNNSSQPQGSGDDEDDDNSSSSSNQNQKNNQKQNKKQDGQGGKPGSPQDDDSDDQNDSQNQQSGDSQGKPSKQGNQQDDSDIQQSGGGYDDTDLSKADSDAMDDYDDDLEVPDISDKSKEYQDAYEDELRKELDKALGKNPRNSDEDSDSDSSDDSGKDSDNSNPMSNGNAGDTGDDSDDADSQDDNGMSTPGSGKPDMQSDQEMDGMDGNGSGDPSEDGEDDDNQSNSGMQGNSSNNQSNSNIQDNNGDSDENGTDSDSMSNDGQMSNRNSNKPMSAEERAAREQARKDIQKALQDLKDKIEAEMSEVPDDEEQQKQLEGKVFETETSSTFGGADMLSQEEMAELAADAGNPYTSQELTADVDELNKQFNEKHDAELKAVSPDLQTKLTDIADKLKALVALANWKQKLRKHFRDAMEGSVEQVRSKRAMSQKWRDGRYNPYKEREFKEQNGANVFYLIDGSGSMYVNGHGVFMQIFKDVITIEKNCNVDMSCRAYFADYAITPKDCAIWDHKTNKNKVLDILTTMGPSGGTDVPDNVMAVTKLKPPYYFNNGDKHTLIMVFTDGETNMGSGWEVLKRIPSKIRKDVVFVILNTKSQIMNILPQIMAQGVPLKNILGINTLTYNND